MYLEEIETDRLHLIALPRAQLARYLDDAEQLEQELGVAVSRAIVTRPLRRAIEMKLAKMDAAPEADHPWCTYWLAVVRDAGYGAGLLGFKGTPDETGAVEIGYGIDPAYEGRGYTTEAARALIDWAFQAPACRTVTAEGVRRDNAGSNRVLEKLGMKVYAETEDTRSWRIELVAS
ncbi:MAG: GNAT family N-acetyltransferase [Anaerolineae bacterium]|jgi:RimJ/RimL family protein N-acetyltransferase